MNPLRTYKYLFAISLLLVFLWSITNAGNSNLISTSIDNLAFDSENDSSGTQIFFSSSPASLKKIDITFQFINKDSTFSFGNLLQTSSKTNSIRLEVQPPNKLLFIIGENQMFPVMVDMKANQPHKLDLSYLQNKYLYIAIDGKEVLRLDDPEILKQDLLVDNFVIGTGFSQTRPFSGLINHFSSTISHATPTYLAQIAQWLTPLTCLLLFSWTSLILFFRSSFKLIVFNIKEETVAFLKNPKALGRGNITQEQCLHPLAIFICALSIGIILYISKITGYEFFGKLKWLPYLLLPAPLFFLALFNFSKREFWTPAPWLIFALLLTYVCYLFISINTIHELNRYLFLYSALTTLCVYLVVRKSIYLIALASLASWLTIFELLNWRAVNELLHSIPIFIAPLSALSIPFIVYCLAQFKPIMRDDLSSKLSLPFKFNANGALALTSAALYIFLSFRTDALFIPGSEYHWEYFVGPIRTIRDGGWLLYDTPSQYGFLNILLASLLPFLSAWHSFYIFQSLILFIASFSVLFTLLRLTDNSWPLKILVFLLVTSSFFFADPAWIGPQPFPSSSVTRFLFCYLLILGSLANRKWRYKSASLSLIWCMGFLWSAESSFYCTVIYLFAITLDACTRPTFVKVIQSIGKQILYSLAFFTIALTSITAFYLIKLGHSPDFLSLYNYAIGYASGYGYVPFPLTGPGNLLFLLFLGIGFAILRSIRINCADIVMPLAATCGCIWAIGSYYFGRPVNQNVIAIFPILIFCSLLALLLLRNLNLTKASIPLLIAATPLFFLVLATYYSNTWWEQLPKIKAFSNNIASRLPVAQSPLITALNKMDPDNKIPRIFFGDGAVPPALSQINNIQERTWAPVPLQLLMPPVSTKKKQKFIDRFMCRHQYNEAILIHKPGAISKELDGFLDIFSQYLVVDYITNIDGYELIYLKKSSAQNSCILNK